MTTRVDSSDVLLLVDLFDDFEHEDGDRLLDSLRERHTNVVSLLGQARDRRVPIVFANDNKGAWDGDATRLVERAAAGPGGALVAAYKPRRGDRFVIKARYSAFDHTPLELILDELRCERLLVAGMTTEGCVTQSAISARELGFKVSVIADACATADARKEEIACRYLVEVVGARVTSVESLAPELHGRAVTRS